MSEQEIYERLNEVFRNVFDDDEIEVEAGTTADDIEDWDSLEHINLISAVAVSYTHLTLPTSIVV